MHLFVLKALKYPYFHVGQGHCAPLKYSEQHTAQKKIFEMAPETKPLSFCKSDLESIEASRTHVEMQLCSQSLQQIPLTQDNMEPSTKPAMLTVEQQEPLSLVKNRQPMNWQSPTRATQTEAENSSTGVRTGRRRWGQTSFKHVTGLDGSEDADAGVSLSKKNTIDSRGERELDEPCGLKRGDSSTLSAKQHYLRQSRYLPGEGNS
ncbi:serine/threonine-protein kinase MAK-like [Tautogolabrus adspersus]